MEFQCVFLDLNKAFMTNTNLGHYKQSRFIFRDNWENPKCENNPVPGDLQ